LHVLFVRTRRRLRVPAGGGRGAAATRALVEAAASVAAAAMCIYRRRGAKRGSPWVRACEYDEERRHEVALFARAPKIYPRPKQKNNNFKVLS